jgi:hypothetical protein
MPTSALALMSLFLPSSFNFAGPENNKIHTYFSSHTQYSIRSGLVYILEKTRQTSTTIISTTSTNPNYIESSDIQ